MNHEKKCPICKKPESVKDTDNLKICFECAELLEWSFDPEVELIANYSKN